jgi:hypothetical protein
MYSGLARARAFKTAAHTEIVNFSCKINSTR